MERGTRKQVLINKIMFLESAIKERDAVIADLRRRLSNAETVSGAKDKKEHSEKDKGK